MANVINHVSIAGSVGTTEASTAVNVKHIFLLKNTHASQTLTINFGALTTEAGAFVLNAGEQLENLPLACGTLYYKGSGSTTTFKFLGEKGFA